MAGDLPRAVNRDLGRRFNQGVPETPACRAGRRFYVTTRLGARVGFLLGPYASHMTALANVDRGRRLAELARPDQADFASFGTASLPGSRLTVFGR
jgi:hypothetical protein